MALSRHGIIHFRQFFLNFLAQKWNLTNIKNDFEKTLYGVGYIIFHKKNAKTKMLRPGSNPAHKESKSRALYTRLSLLLRNRY